MHLEYRMLVDKLERAALIFVLCLYFPYVSKAADPTCSVRTELALPNLASKSMAQHQFYVTCKEIDGGISCRSEWVLYVDNQSEQSIKLQPPERWKGPKLVIHPGKIDTVTWSGVVCPIARAINHAERHPIIAPSLKDEGAIVFLAKSPKQHKVIVRIHADDVWRIRAFGSAQLESSGTSPQFIVPPLPEKTRGTTPLSGIELVRLKQIRNGGVLYKIQYGSRSGSDYNMISIGYEVNYARLLAASLSIEFGEEMLIVPGISWQQSLASFIGIEIGAGMPISAHNQDLAARFFVELGLSFGVALGFGAGIDCWAGLGDADSEIGLFYFLRVSF